MTGPSDGRWFTVGVLDLCVVWQFGPPLLMTALTNFRP